MRKQATLLMSTMRSGSTLLKALLGNAKDISHLNEVNFQRERSVQKALRQSKERHVILKNPAWFNDLWTYPLNAKRRKKIILYRNPHDTINSVKKMMLGKFSGTHLFDRFFLNTYWYRINKRLLDRFSEDPQATFIDYDQLLKNPKKETARLYAFIGSTCKEGTDTYEEPATHWRWGWDDNSDVIRSKRVKRRKQTKKDERLTALIKASPRIKELQRRYAERLKKNEKRSALSHEDQDILADTQ